MHSFSTLNGSTPLVADKDQVLRWPLFCSYKKKEERLLKFRNLQDQKDYTGGVYSGVILCNRLGSRVDLVQTAPRLLLVIMQFLSF